MAKQNNTGLILLIVVIVGLFFFLPKLSLFSILPPGQCYYNSAGTFITNANHPTNINDYNIPYGDVWVSTDWNQDGTLESYGWAAGHTGDDLCAAKTVIGYTPDGLRIVKWQESNFKEVAICSVDGRSSAIFRDTLQLSDAKTSVTQCSNYVEPCIENWQTTAWSSCVNGTQYRTATDLNSCNTLINKPITSQTCTISATETTKEQVITASNNWINKQITLNELINTAKQWLKI